MSSNYTLHQQDCLAWMRTQADNTIDIIVSSPPYNIGIGYNKYKDKRTDYLEWQREVWEQACRILKPTGHLFLNIAPTKAEPFLPYLVANNVPWKVQNQIIWAKAIEFQGHIYGRSTVNINSQYALPNGWEMIWHFTHKGKTPISITQSSVPYRPEYAEENTRRTGRTHRPTTTAWHIGYETTGSWGQASAAVKGTVKHPAIYPRELVRHCLNVAGAQPGHIVFDPFAGTGTTLLVAKEMGIDSVGCEIDPDYATFIHQRLK